MSGGERNDRYEEEQKYYIGENGVELHPKNDHYNIIHVSENDEFYFQGQVLGVFREYN